MTSPNTALALDYLEKHFGTRYLFPIRYGEKSPPLIPENLKNASNDPEQIEAWGKRWPTCNWGVALKKSNLFVVDVDTKPGKVGRDTYDAHALANDWPETETVRTPSGGLHYYHEGEHRFALGEYGFGRDIDCPNYVLIPGCALRDGTSYEAINELPAVAAPQWFYDVLGTAKKDKIENAADVVVDLDKPENVEWARDFLQNDAPLSIEGQGGEQQTLKVAMALRDRGISEPFAVELMLEEYNERCEPPWDRDGLEQKISNAYEYASLSAMGGRTAEADFMDDPPEPFTPQGNPDMIAEQVTQRKQDKADGIVPLVESNRSKILYRSQNIPRAVYDAMKVIRADKKHDHIFRRGPEIVRLNQQLTPAELEGAKPTDVKRKRGALVIREVVGDYMTFRLAEAARFYVKSKKTGRPKNDEKGA
jgi:Bifunctional DNA primase/polymerase, N-terminal